jgi:hypothetical protein
MHHPDDAPVLEGRVIAGLGDDTADEMQGLVRFLSIHA